MATGGISYEDLMDKLPSKSVIQAVESSKGGKVVASDVASSAGVSLSQARKDLTALASLTRGDIAVSSDGELIYTFPPNLNSVLSSNSFKYKAISFFEKIWPGLFYAIRVSFGVVLLASLFAIFSTIFFVSQGGSSDDDRRRDDRGFGGGGGGGFGGSYFWGPSPFDFFYYRPYYGYYGAPGQAYRDPDEMGFLESTFSYIFGDGDPNNGLEEQRLRLAANVIRENNGAVTAEQLAPFCDDIPAPDLGKESSYVDESFVLPIVTALNGEPRVTEDGDIVYVFEDLQISATGSDTAQLARAETAMMLKRVGLEPDASTRDIKNFLNMNGISTRGALEKEDLLNILGQVLPPLSAKEEEELRGAVEDPTALQEREYKFSLASDTNRFLAGALGVVNLLGALYLGNMFQTYAVYDMRLPSYFGVVQAGFPFLLAYAFLFNAIPIARSFWIKGQNEKIQERNKIRRMWRTVVDTAVGGVGRKLKAAARMGTRMKKLGSSKDDIVFDTSKSFSETMKMKEKQSMKDFDKLLEQEDEKTKRLGSSKDDMTIEMKEKQSMKDFDDKPFQ